MIVETLAFAALLLVFAVPLGAAFGPDDLAVLRRWRQRWRDTLPAPARLVWWTVAGWWWRRRVGPPAWQPGELLGQPVASAVAPDRLRLAPDWRFRLAGFRAIPARQRLAGGAR